MSKQNEVAHTAGPWEVINDGDGWAIVGEGGLYTIAKIPNISRKPENSANAARIVACVNYCDGATAEQINTRGGLMLAVDGLRAALKNAEAERDSLKAANEKLREALRSMLPLAATALRRHLISSYPHNPERDEEIALIETARAALAAAGGAK